MVSKSSQSQKNFFHHKEQFHPQMIHLFNHCIKMAQHKNHLHSLHTISNMKQDAHCCQHPRFIVDDFEHAASEVGKDDRDAHSYQLHLTLFMTLKEPLKSAKR
jgi:hypothetical protein